MRAVRSVEPGTEVVVVDDNSDPDEAHRIAEFMAQVPNGVLIRSDESIGAPRARNLAAENAKGNVLAFLDSDDWWLPGRLAPHLQGLRHPRYSLSYNRTRLTLPSGKAGPRMLGYPAPKRLSLETAITAWNFVGGSSSVCVARDAFERVGGFDPQMPSCQDWELWHRLAGVGEFLFVPVGSTVMDIGRHERITTNNDRAWAGHDLMEQKAKALDVSPRDKRIIHAYHQLSKAEIAARFGQPRRSFAHLWESLRSYPTRQASWRALLLTGKNLRTVLSS